MPSKNVMKTYAEDGYYHIYNRGVNKQVVFQDQQDYSVFLSYLKTYLLPKEKDKLASILSEPNASAKEKDSALRLLHLNNFYGRIELLAYCLMPNHFHFLVHQKEAADIDSFMQSFMTRFTMYANVRYDRVGTLFQGRYKAVIVETDSQLLYLTRYIHRNPIESKRSDLIRSDLFKQPSSYPVYLGRMKQDWVKPAFILQNFSSSGFNSYQSFVESEDSTVEDQTMFTVSKVALDLD